MKLTMTNRASGHTAVVAEPRPGLWASPLHLDRDGTLNLAVLGNGGHVYTLSASRDEWQALFLRIEDLYDRAPDPARAPEVSGLVTDPQADPREADPTPLLSEGVRQDMAASALDVFRRQGRCRFPDLWSEYGFTSNQVLTYGKEAIAAARARWELEGGQAA